jgi:serine/threonine protein kinase
MLSRLGRFEIKGEIGRGGFGQVFLASDPVMHRVVAIKVLTATEDAASFDRFKNEATAAGNLQHENIVTVHEFGQEGQIPFLVMEYLKGEDLQQIIRNRTPLSLYQKLRIMDQVADGLHFAHRSGVVHRDVKPANVMVLEGGLAKVMDFGIARLMLDTSPRLTRQGYLVGTVIYMAPELFTSPDVEPDALSDIWSYGVILYELLSGKNPFQTGSMQSEMYRILHEDPPPLATSDCPADLQAILNRLMSRNRETRYQSLEDTRFDLQPVLKNLEKAEADRLVSDARQMMFEQKLDEALEAARKARKMDPQNGSARITFERIQDEKRKQSVRLQIDDLVRRSRQAADQRKIAEAMALLKEAQKLDSSDEKVLANLQDLHQLKLKLEEAETLITEAGKEFHDGRLTAAFEHASDAVLHDPANPEAKRLLESIRDALQTRENENALDVEILHVRGLVAVNDLELALETLRAAQSKYYDRKDARELAGRIVQLIAERDSSREYSGRLNQAKELVRTARFEEAVKELEGLRESFPHQSELTDLLAYATRESKSRKRSERVKQITDTAAELTRSLQFDEAIRIIEEGLKEYPDDFTLPRLLRATYSALQDSERERALQAGLQRCEEFRQQHKWKEALNLVKLLLSDNPNHPDLRELAEKIRQERDQTESAAGARSSVEKAEALLREGRPDSAITVLEAAILSMGAQSELTVLLNRAREAQKAENDRQYIEAELQHAEAFEKRGDFATGLKIIEGALHRFPQSAELSVAKERFNQAQRVPPTAEAQAPSLQPQVPAPKPYVRPIEPDEHLEPAAPKWRIYALSATILAALAGVVTWLLPSGVKVTPEKLTFAYSPGGNLPSQTITATSSREIPDPKTSENWIRFTRRNVGSDKAEFAVEISPAELTPGSHTAYLTFPSHKIPVNVTVASANVDFRPPSVTFSYAPGAIPAQKVVVTSPSKIPDPKASEPWVTFTRRNIAKDRAEFDVHVSANGLAAGPHSAFLTFGNIGKVPVGLMIPGGATIEIYPAFLAFPGGGQQQKVIVTGPGVLPDPKPSEPWIAFTRANVSPGKAEFLVTISAGALPPGLPPGKKYGSLIFSSDRKVQVELTPGPALLDIQPDTLAFPGAGNQQTITVTGPVAIPDPTSTDPWLTFTRRDSGPGKSEFAIQASSHGLAVGPHVAYLAFAPEKQVRVQLTVAPLEVQPSELRFKYKRGGPAPQPQTITATGPPDMQDPSKKAPWIQWTRTGSGSKTQFVVQILPDKLTSDANVDDLIFSPRNKVRIDALVLDAPEAAPESAGTIFWSGGALNPGDELWIKEKRMVRGPGAISGRLPKADIKIDRTKLPPAIRVLEEPSQENNFILRLQLSSAPPLYYLAIPWSLKK